MKEFTLVEAAGSADERLRRARADRRDDMREVMLPAAKLDPRREALAGKRARERDETSAVVQFVGLVRPAGWSACCARRSPSTGAPA
jgi:hypothetical protein